MDHVCEGFTDCIHCGRMLDDTPLSTDVQPAHVGDEIPAHVEDKYRDGNAKWETGQIPASVRDEVHERDGNTCRFCGGYVEHPALHHVVYRSEGGLNRPDNLITTHWMYAPRCHERIHDRKRLWQPLGLQVITTPGLTMLQLERWQRTRRRT